MSTTASPPERSGSKLSPRSIGRGIVGILVSPWTACRARASRLASMVAIAGVLFVAISSAAYQFYLPVTGEGPDEPGHYAVASYIAERGKPPRVEQAGFQAQIIKFTVDDQGQTRALQYPYVSYASMPPGAYTFSALFAKLPSDTRHSDIRQARIPQAIWAALTVLFLFLAAGAAFPKRANEVGILVVVLASFWPRLAFTSAYVNNDAMMVAATTGILWRWWEGYRSGWRRSDAVWLGVMLGAALIAKPNGYIVAAMSLLVAAICVRRPFKQYIGRIGIAGVVSLIPALPWLWVATRRYGLDLFASSVVADQVRDLPASDLSAGARGLSYWHFVKDFWADPMLRSYLAWADIPMWASASIVGIVFVGLIGLVAAGVRALASPRATVRSREAWLHFVCVMVFPALLIASSLNSYFNDSFFGMQGRYLLPAFSFSVLYLAVGATLLATDRLARRILTLVVIASMWSFGRFAFSEQLVAGRASVLPEGAVSIEPYVRWGWLICAGAFATTAIVAVLRSNGQSALETGRSSE